MSTLLRTREEESEEKTEETDPKVREEEEEVQLEEETETRREKSNQQKSQLRPLKENDLFVNLSLKIKDEIKQYNIITTMNKTFTL